MDVQSGGAISVNGKGYASAQGPGSGTDLSVGGTYGGRGKDNIKNSYGSLDNPVDLGSGGYNPAGTGGGAAILSVSGTLNVSGTISADGIGGICCTAPGYGSGGSVNISAGTLTGAGDVYAKGGQEYDTWLNAGGGGGRISFSGVENDNFTGEINANGSYVGDSHAGTIYLSPEKRSSWTITSGQTYRLGSDGTNNYTFNNITIENGGVLEIDSDPLMNSGSGGTATINASNVTIDTGGIFRADGLGFENGEGPGAGNDGMKGGTYGGRGYGNSDATYGSIDNPIHIGSSGTGGAEPGGKGPNGGGAISLSLSGALTINGTLSANGNAGRNTCASAGSGSGGSINIVAATLAGTTGSIDRKSVV